MRILFTICGRAGSKGIKNKNIRDFLGYPLPYYTLSAIDLYIKKNPQHQYDIVVNSDSRELLKMMNSNPMRGVELIERDRSLAGDKIGKIDVIRNCMEIMQKRKSCTYDIIVDLDITSPLRRVIDLEELIKIHSAKKPDVTTSVAPARRNPYFNQVKRVERGVKRVIDSDYTARQQAPKIFDMNASLYAYDPDYLKQGKGVLDGYCEIIEMYDTGILDLDHENDFRLMEIIAKYLYENIEDFSETRNNIQNHIVTKWPDV